MVQHLDLPRGVLKRSNLVSISNGHSPKLERIRLNVVLQAQRAHTSAGTRPHHKGRSNDQPQKQRKPRNPVNTQQDKPDTTPRTPPPPRQRSKPGVLRKGLSGTLLIWTDLAKAPVCKHDIHTIRASLRTIANPYHAPPNKPPTLSLRALCQLSHALGRAYTRHPSVFGTLERQLLVDALDALSYRVYLQYFASGDDIAMQGAARRQCTASNMCQLLEGFAKTAHTPSREFLDAIATILLPQIPTLPPWRLIRVLQLYAQCRHNPLDGHFANTVQQHLLTPLAPAPGGGRTVVTVPGSTAQRAVAAQRRVLQLGRYGGGDGAQVVRALASMGAQLDDGLVRYVTKMVGKKTHTLDGQACCALITALADACPGPQHSRLAAALYSRLLRASPTSPSTPERDAITSKTHTSITHMTEAHTSNTHTSNTTTTTVLGAAMDGGAAGAGAGACVDTPTTTPDPTPTHPPTMTITSTGSYSDDEDIATMPTPPPLLTHLSTPQLLRLLEAAPLLGYTLDHSAIDTLCSALLRRMYADFAPEDACRLLRVLSVVQYDALDGVVVTTLKRQLSFGPVLQQFTSEQLAGFADDLVKLRSPTPGFLDALATVALDQLTTTMTAPAFARLLGALAYRQYNPLGGALLDTWGSLIAGRTEHQLLSTADADSLTITLTALSALQHRLPSDAVDAVGSCLVDHCGSLGPQKWADVGIALSDQGYKDPLSGTLLPSIAHSVLERELLPAFDDLQLVEFVWGLSKVGSPGSLPSHFLVAVEKEANQRAGRLPGEERQLLMGAIASLQQQEHEAVVGA